MSFPKAATRPRLHSYAENMFDDIDNMLTALLLGTAAMMPWFLHVSQLSQR